MLKTKQGKNNARGTEGSSWTALHRTNFVSIRRLCFFTAVWPDLGTHQREERATRRSASSSDWVPSVGIRWLWLQCGLGAPRGFLWQ
ncbi:hypothetical protein O3P69_011119 [Scylla paramamosain]|uniref:Uncharacterized protein n=1 Tax=Scylla paramamosain TaxID=85552 RepID=A0AAW0STH1_SCYPA